tara:strand:- start:284 stop:427 length:144 start_codon:yes stop_codon:yes gene_type:complete
MVTRGTKPLSQIKTEINIKQIRPLLLTMQEEIVLGNNFGSKISFHLT